MAYLTWWRLTFGARLLTEADASLNEVASRIGDISEFAFAMRSAVSMGSRREDTDANDAAHFRRASESRGHARKCALRRAPEQR